MSSPIIITIEGNIGVGKSTFVNIIKSNWLYDCKIVDEPVDMWKKIQDSDGKNILQTFYDDIPRWAYTFQNLVYVTRMIKIEDAIKSGDSKYIFLDRSLETDSNVFEKMLYDSKQISVIEHKAYELWCNFYYNYVRKQHNPIHIYLKASSSVCMNRIQKRNRIEEKGIDINYLDLLNKYHDDWLLNSTNTIIIDCNEDFENDKEKQNEMIQQIENKINLILANNNSIKSKIEVEFDCNHDLNNKIIYN